MNDDWTDDDDAMVDSYHGTFEAQAAVFTARLRELGRTLKSTLRRLLEPEEPENGD